MRQDFSFQLAQGTGDYTPTGNAPTGAALSDFKKWWTDTLRVYRTSIGVGDEQWLVNWPYSVFRDTYRYNLQSTLQGRPVVFAVRPRDNALMFGAIPDATYTCVGEYQIAPVALTADTDTPAIDTDLHEVIVYKAMLSYGIEQAAGEVIARATAKYNELLGRMRDKYLPEVRLSAPLA